MKLLISIFVLIFSMSAFATGKISVQGNYFDQNPKELKPLYGFSVYQKVARNLFVNSWLGYGAQPLEQRASDINWYVGKAQLDFQMNRLTVAPGVQYKYVKSGDLKIKDTIPFVKAEFQLW